MFFQHKVVGRDLAANFNKAAVVQQQRAKNEFLGVEVGGKALVERYTVRHIAAERSGHGGVCQNTLPGSRIFNNSPCRKQIICGSNACAVRNPVLGENSTGGTTISTLHCTAKMFRAECLNEGSQYFGRLRFVFCPGIVRQHNFLSCCVGWSVRIPGQRFAGTGSGTVIIDNVLNTMSLHLDFTGLTGTTSASHIHCCTAFIAARQCQERGK